MEQAVVVGAGVAGLLAARALAQHFARVIVIERDALPATPVPRPGVPQGVTVHSVLLRGQEVLEDFFPGYKSKLIASGGVAYDVAADMREFRFGRWLPRVPTGLTGIFASGALWEWTIRRELEADARIRFVDQTAVDSLRLADGRVTGVRLSGKHGASELSADFVVDATGRASGAARWLRAIGYERPKKRIVRAPRSYASRRYRFPKGWPYEWKALLIEDNAASRAAELVPLEGGCWAVGVVDAAEPPPQDEIRFRDLIRSLPSPLLHEVLETAEPISPIRIYRQRGSRILDAEALARWPNRLVVLGEAFCSLNPDYTQGITMATLAASALDVCLRSRAGALDDVASDFHSRLVEIYALPWFVATGTPMRAADAGTASWWSAAASALLKRYLDAIVACAPYDARIYRTLLEVKNMVKPAVSFLHPRFAARMIRCRCRLAMGTT